MEEVRDLLNLSYVQRWVIAPMHRPQSVAEHSFRVAALVLGLHKAVVSLGSSFILEHAIRYAISHDVEEAFTGDIPGTDKDDKGKVWVDPVGLCDWEIAVKVADAMESWDWWLKHGDKTWYHPKFPIEGERDIKKILHYSGTRPSILTAAKVVMVEALGYNESTVYSMFRRVADVMGKDKEECLKLN